MAFSNNKSIFSLIGTTQTKLINFKFQERERERDIAMSMRDKRLEWEYIFVKCLIFVTNFVSKIQQQQQQSYISYIHFYVFIWILVFITMMKNSNKINFFSHTRLDVSLRGESGGRDKVGIFLDNTNIFINT